MTDYLKYLNDRAIAMGYIGEELDEQSALNWIANAWSLDVNDANYVLKRDLDFELDKKADKEHTYTMDEMDIQLDEKADKSNTYTKKEVDDAIAASTGGPGGVTEDRVKELVESETTPKFDLKADKSETYTKTEVDGLIPTVDVDKAYVDTELGKKADAADLDLKADKSDTYTKQEVDDKVAAGGGSADVDKAYVDAGLALKADKTDTYTKTEVNDLVDQAAIGLPLEQGLHGVTPNGYEKITPNSMGYGPAHDWSWELSAVSGDKFGKMDKWGVNYHALWCDSPTSTLQLGPYDNSLQIGGFGNNGIFGMISDFGDDKLGFYMDTKLGVLEMAGNDGIKRRILTKGDTYETHETYTKLEIDNAISMIPASEKFTDLADTPSGYHPNKLVGYNLAGDALIPVDKTESFIQLNDVPNTWVGHARKVPMVRPDETGMDFVMLPSTDLGPLEGRMNTAETTIVDHETRITAIELGGGPGTGVDLTPVLDRLTAVETKNSEQDAELDQHLLDFDSMTTGQIPTSWNGLACDPMSSSGDVTAINIATTPFCVGMGSSTGRKFILPNIVDANSNSVTNSQVREGRITYLVNLGTQPRTVDLSGGCKINMTGINTTTSQTIPAKVTWMLSPGIYSNGDRVWTFLGSYSAEPLDYSNMHNGYAEKISLMAGATPVHMGSMFSTSTPVWDTVTQEQAALREVINFWGTSTSRGVNLPDIVDGNTTTVPANAVRSGRMLIVANRSSNNKFMKVDNGCQFYKDATDLSTANINLAKGNVVVLVASKSGADKYWQLIGSFTATASTDHEGLMNRITTLEGRPNPKFTELTDTPSGYTGNAGKIPMVNTGESGIEFVDLPSFDASVIETRLDDVEDKNAMQDTRLDAQSLRIDQLEVAPRVTKFNELTDTPNDYRPGRILAYNMAGDGITSVAPFNHLTALDDTPSSYSGQKRKALVVKEDETGTEFVDMPNLAPLQTDVNNLHNDIIGLNNEQTIQNNEISALETRVSTLETAPSSNAFIDMTDTPDTYDAKKYIVVNSSGTGLEFSSMDTDDVGELTLLASGIGTGNALVHQNCLGAPCVLSGEQTIASTQIAASAMVLVSAWQNNTTVNFPRIAGYNVSPLPANYVRAGRITSIYNRTANSKTITIKPDPAFTALKMKDKGYNNITTLSLAPGQVAKFIPVIDAGVQAWVLIEQYNC